MKKILIAGANSYIGVSVENYLKHNVAKLLAQKHGIACIYRLDHLIGLFYKIISDRFVGLLSVPRATLLRAKNLHHLNEIFKSVFAF